MYSVHGKRICSSFPKLAYDLLYTASFRKLAGPWSWNKVLGRVCGQSENLPCQKKNELCMLINTNEALDMQATWNKKFCAVNAPPVSDGKL